MSDQDTTAYPEGFDDSCGIPSKFMQAANQALASCTGNRQWDVPTVAAALQAAALAARVETLAELKVEPMATEQLHFAAKKMCLLLRQDPNEEISVPARFVNAEAGMTEITKVPQWHTWYWELKREDVKRVALALAAAARDLLVAAQPQDAEQTTNPAD